MPFIPCRRGCWLVILGTCGPLAHSAQEPNHPSPGTPAYQINRWVIANGSHEMMTLPMASTRYRLTATTGQPLITRSGSDVFQNTYRLQSGFWRGNTELIFYSQFE